MIAQHNPAGAADAQEAPSLPQPGDTPPEAPGDKFILSRPIMTHGGLVRELTLQEPRAGLVFKHGLPWRQKVETNDAGGVKSFEVEFDPAKMGLYIEAMCGLDQMALEDAAAKDVAMLFQAVFTMMQPVGN